VDMRVGVAMVVSILNILFTTTSMLNDQSLSSNSHRLGSRNKVTTVSMFSGTSQTTQHVCALSPDWTTSWHCTHTTSTTGPYSTDNDVTHTSIMCTALTLHHISAQQYAMATLSNEKKRNKHFNWSHTATHLVVFVDISCWSELFKKA